MPPPSKLDIIHERSHVQNAQEKLLKHFPTIFTVTTQQANALLMSLYQSC